MATASTTNSILIYRQARGCFALSPTSQFLPLLLIYPVDNAALRRITIDQFA